MDEFLNQQRIDDLKLLYSLYVDEPESLRPIGDRFRKFIADQGKNLLRSVELRNQENKPFGLKELLHSSQLVEKLLKMLEEFMHVVKYCFDSNSSFNI